MNSGFDFSVIEEHDPSVCEEIRSPQAPALPAIEPIGRPSSLYSLDFESDCSDCFSHLRSPTIHMALAPCAGGGALTQGISSQPRGTGYCTIGRCPLRSETRPTPTMLPRR